jgi:hypothetical protein
MNVLIRTGERTSERCKCGVHGKKSKNGGEEEGCELTEKNTNNKERKSKDNYSKN